MNEYTPKQIVDELNKYIIGQDKAKKAVAIALRNRYRRKLLSDDMKDEVIPKNILMIGPTGVGKQRLPEDWRRISNAPSQGRGYQIYRSRLCGTRCGFYGEGSCSTCHKNG